MVTGKFSVTKIEQPSRSSTDRRVTLAAIYPDGGSSEIEDTDFHTATPQGNIEIYVTNTAASEQFELGKVFYVEFSAAE